MAKQYNHFVGECLKGSAAAFSLTASTIKVMLVTSAYTFNVEDQFVSSVSSAELSGTGYTGGFGGSGRKTLTTTVVNVDGTNHACFFDADNLVWSAINAGTVAAAILIWEHTNDAASWLIAYIDTGGFPVATNGNDFDLNWNSLGILEIQP